MDKENTKIFEDILKSSTMAEKLIYGLEERQRETLKELPSYGKTTLYISLAILLLGLTVQLITGSISNNQLFQSLKNPTIGGILSVFFTLVAYIINAVFAVWALSFIPYIAFRSFKVSQRISIPIRVNSSKWIQLFAATFFPIFAFAIFATNVPQTKSSFIIQFTYIDGFVIIVGGLTCWAILWGATRYIPLKLVVAQLTIFSVILYATIFFAYILGFGTATYAVVLGMTLFLMQSSSKLGDIARRVSIYDIDTNIADKISSVSTRDNEIKIKEAEADMLKHESQLEGKVQKIQNEIKISEQLQNIQTQNIDFNSRVNSTKLDTFNKKLEILNQLYSILAEEYKVKVDQEIPVLISKFKEDVKKMTPVQLSEQMNKIIGQVNGSLDTIPQELDNIKLQMKEATKQLKQATEELAEENK